MLLSDEEISQISLSAVTVKDATEDVRAIEAAILAKLASAELLPVQDLSDEEKQFIHYNPNTDDLVDFIQGHAAAYGQQAYAQGFAAGAAAQLAEKPLAYFYHDASCPEMANPLLHSTLLLHVDDRNSNLKNETPLYTRREA